MKRLIISAMLAGAFLLQGQTPEQLGSTYYAYPEPVSQVEACSPDIPEGYEPFYISHYGRHGSRWLTTDDRYRKLVEVFDMMPLTPYGEEVAERIRIIAADGIGRAGELSPVGERQHRGIAKRMMQRWPEVFADSTEIHAKSSTKMRCAMSMAAFCEALKEENPRLRITRTAYERDMPVLAGDSPEAKAYNDSVEHSKGYHEFVRATIDPSRLMSSLFINPGTLHRGKQVGLMTELYWVAQDMQNVELGISLYDIFLPEEIEAVWRTINARMYMCNMTGSVATHDADPLLQTIRLDLSEAMAKDVPTVDLRFGHDTHLLRLLALMGIGTADIFDYADVADKWHDYELAPMAANLQLVFYRNREGDVLCKAFLNEAEIPGWDPRAAASGGLLCLPTAGR